MQHGFHNREMLAHMIMAALTSVDGNPRITTRTGEGGQRRDYAAVTFVYGLCPIRFLLTS